jgi:hypothetical protein
VRTAEKLVRDVIFNPELTGCTDLRPRQVNAGGGARHPSAYAPSTKAIADAPASEEGAAPPSGAVPPPPAAPTGPPGAGAPHEANGFEQRDQPEHRVSTCVCMYMYVCVCVSVYMVQ